MIRVCVAFVLALVLALTAAQHAAHVGPWWLELSRYVPFPAPLAAVAIAGWLSWSLGRAWFISSVVTALLLAVFGMGFEWHSPDSGSQPLRMMAYNIKAYRAWEVPNGFEKLGAEVARHKPDLLVVEDATGVMGERSVSASSHGPLFGLPYTFAVSQFVIASRFPVSDCALGNGVPGDASRYAHCTVTIDGKPLIVVVVHFESPRQGLNAARREGVDGIDEWQQNYEDRLEQSRRLAAYLRQIDRKGAPLIVAGDLNAPEPSPVVQSLLQTGLRDAFSSAGRGFGYTHGHALKVGFSFLRIDHILVSPELGVAACFVGGKQASEHRPVIADLLLNHGADSAARN